MAKRAGYITAVSSVGDALTLGIAAPSRAHPTLEAVYPPFPKRARIIDADAGTTAADEYAKIKAIMDAAAARSDAQRAAQEAETRQKMDDTYDEFAGLLAKYTGVGYILVGLGPIAKPFFKAGLSLMEGVASLFGGPDWNSPEQQQRAMSEAAKLATFGLVPEPPAEGMTDDWEHWADQSARTNTRMEWLRDNRPAEWATYQKIVQWVNANPNDRRLLDLQAAKMWPMPLPGLASSKGAVALATLLAASEGKSPTNVLPAMVNRYQQAYWENDGEDTLRYTTNYHLMLADELATARALVSAAPALPPTVFKPLNISRPFGGGGAAINLAPSIPFLKSSSPPTSPKSKSSSGGAVVLGLGAAAYFFLR
jgi:hypothetical protein